MSIDKHTPGPWEVVKKSSDRKMKLYFDIHMKGLSGIVASIPSFAVVNLEESCANAELIALAPTLLAENKRLLIEHGELSDQLSIVGYDKTVLERENKRLREALEEIKSRTNRGDFDSFEGVSIRLIIQKAKA